jgi:hypothetical protein
MRKWPPGVWKASNVPSRTMRLTVGIETANVAAASAALMQPGSDAIVSRFFMTFAGDF